MKYKLINEDIRSNYLEQMMINRGCNYLSDLLCPSEHFLQSYKDLDNIEDGVQLLDKTIKKNGNILIICDCDNDGFTSAAIMWQYIKKISSTQELSFLLHENKEHGLEDLIDSILDSNERYDLIIMPDAGSNDYIYIEQLKELQTKVLILDHHILDEDSPVSDNCVLINNMTSKNYKNKNLTGAGVVYQFCRALDEYYNVNYADDFIDLAAVGIIGDMGNILSLENKYIIDKGLSLENLKNSFIKTIFNERQFSMKGVLNYNSVAFYITPLINAMIRVGSMEDKREMFLAFIDGDTLVVSNKRGAKGQLVPRSEEVVRICTNTKNRQDKMRESAAEELEQQIIENNLLENKILIIKLDEDYDFPKTLNGLLAMELSVKYGRPTLVLRQNKNDLSYSGSARGIDKSELKSLKNYLTSTGLVEYAQGHDNAHGVKIKNKNIDSLIKKSNEELNQYSFDENCFEVDFLKKSDDKNIKDLILEIGQYQDIWGTGNKEPLICVEDIPLYTNNISVVGTRKEVVKINYNDITYILFKGKELLKELNNEDYSSITVVGTANINEWQGYYNPQIVITDYELKKDLPKSTIDLSF